MILQNVPLERLLTIRLGNGDDILASLQTAIAKENIKNALIMSGIGSVKTYHFHVVKTGNIPPGDIYIKGEKPLDILNVNGFIIDGRVHGHITLSDDASVIGGHLEPGCHVLTFSMIVLAVLGASDFVDWDSFKIM